MASYIDDNVTPWLLDAFCIHYNRCCKTTYSTKQVQEGLSLTCNFWNTDELHTVRQKHFCSHQCQCNTLLALCLSWIWFIKSHCVDKQKQQALLTHTHTHTASVWRAAVELELTGLSAGCVMGYTPSQVIRRSPQRSLEGSALLSAGCTQPSNTAAQLDETTAPAGKTRTVCASTLNFLAGFCEAATSSPCTGELTLWASDSVRYLSSRT